MAGTDLERFTKLMLDEFGRVHERLDNHDDRFDAIDVRFDRVERELQEICSEIRGIRRDPEDLTKEIGNMLGYRKEIDHALERIAAIEKRLGIEKRLSA